MALSLAVAALLPPWCQSRHSTLRTLAPGTFAGRPHLHPLTATPGLAPAAPARGTTHNAAPLPPPAVRQRRPVGVVHARGLVREREAASTRCRAAVPIRSRVVAGWAATRRSRRRARRRRPVRSAARCRRRSARRSRPGGCRPRGGRWPSPRASRSGTGRRARGARTRPSCARRSNTSRGAGDVVDADRPRPGEDLVRPLALDRVVGRADHLEPEGVALALEQPGGCVDEQVAALAVRDHGDGPDRERARRVADRGSGSGHRSGLVDDPGLAAAPGEPFGARARHRDDLVEIAARRPGAASGRGGRAGASRARAGRSAPRRAGRPAPRPGQDRVRVHERRAARPQEGAVAAQVPGAALTRLTGPGGRRQRGCCTRCTRGAPSTSQPPRGELVVELARLRRPETELPAALREQRHDPLHRSGRPAEVGLVKADDDPGPTHPEPG